jgi:GAF domain-containing protein
MKNPPAKSGYQSSPPVNADNNIHTRSFTSSQIDELIQKAAIELKADSIILYLINLETTQPFFWTSFGLNTNPRIKDQDSSWKGLTWRVIQKRDIVTIPDIWADSLSLARKHLFQGERFISYQGMPLIKEGKLIGVLEILNREKFIPDNKWFSQLREFVNGLTEVIRTG